MPGIFPAAIIGDKARIVQNLDVDSRPKGRDIISDASSFC